MPTPTEFTSKERIAFQDAVGNREIANRILNKIDGLTRAGTVGSSLTVDEQSAGEIHVSTITFDDLVVAITDSGGANGGIGSKKIYDFPEGLIQIEGVVVDLDMTAASGISATATVKHSVGTSAVSGNDTLNGAEANVVQSTDTTLSSSAGAAASTSLMTAITALNDNSGGTPSNTIADISASPTEAEVANGLASCASKINEILAYLALLGYPLQPVVDGTATAKDLYLNFGIANAGISATSSLTLNGTVTIAWRWLGDK